MPNKTNTKRYQAQAAKKLIMSSSRNNESKDFLSALPDELLLEICDNLDGSATRADLVALTRTNKRLRYLAVEYLWKSLKFGTSYHRNGQIIAAYQSQPEYGSLIREIDLSWHAQGFLLLGLVQINKIISIIMSSSNLISLKMRKYSPWGFSDELSPVQTAHVDFPGRVIGNLTSLQLLEIQELPTAEIPDYSTIKHWLKLPRLKKVVLHQRILRGLRNATPDFDDTDVSRVQHLVLEDIEESNFMHVCHCIIPMMRNLRTLKVTLVATHDAMYRSLLPVSRQYLEMRFPDLEQCLTAVNLSSRDMDIRWQFARTMWYLILGHTNMVFICE